jgi:hypothetical protein
MADYRIQGDAYAELVKAITGKAPVAVSFATRGSDRHLSLEPGARHGSANRLAFAGSPG